MGLDSVWHWVLLLVIVLVIFGTGKLAKMGPDLGNAVRGFKKAMHDPEEEAKKKAEEERLRADPPIASSHTTQSQHDSSDVK